MIGTQQWENSGYVTDAWAKNMQSNTVKATRAVKLNGPRCKANCYTRKPKLKRSKGNGVVNISRATNSQRIEGTSSLHMVPVSIKW